MKVFRERSEIRRPASAWQFETKLSHSGYRCNHTKSEGLVPFVYLRNDRIASAGCCAWRTGPRSLNEYLPVGFMTTLWACIRSSTLMRGIFGVIVRCCVLSTEGPQKVAQELTRARQKEGKGYDASPPRRYRLP